jgi:Protein of unknown function (DUF664)
MADMSDPKIVLRHYLQAARDDLIWKLDGLDERDARLPRTPTGNNLLGVLKHCLNVEAGCFGPTFGRKSPTPEELVPYCGVRGGLMRTGMHGRTRQKTG